MPLPDSFAGRSAVPPAEPLPAAVLDAHTHLDACGADEQGTAAFLARAAAVGVVGAITVGDDLASARWAAAAAAEHPSLWAAVAVHPTRADEFDDEAAAALGELARQDRVVAVGETGLDAYWISRGVGADLARQREVFAWHVQLAKDVGKPLMIHDRDAHEQILDVLDAEGAPDAVVFHCFSGDADFARRCLDRGFVLSFAGPVTFRSARELQEAARLVPSDAMTVETDAPYLAPHPHRGTVNEPAGVAHTVRALAALRGQDLEELCHALRATTERVYGISAGWPPQGPRPARTDART